MFAPFPARIPAVGIPSLHGKPCKIRENSHKYCDITGSKYKTTRMTDMSILHHAFISIFIALWAVITRYVTILMAILSYFTRFIMKRENVGS